MDSKLKKTAIFFCVMAILSIALIVVMANWRAIFGDANKSVTADKNIVTQEQIKEDGQIGDDLRGFLTDDTFFDKEKDDYDWNSLYNSNKLSMIVTSIEKDLRIQIVD